MFAAIKKNVSSWNIEECIIRDGTENLMKRTDNTQYGQPEKSGVALTLMRLIIEFLVQRPFIESLDFMLRLG